MSSSSVDSMAFLDDRLAEEVEPCRLAGDFYREPDDIVRNIDIPMDWLADAEGACLGRTAEPYKESKFDACSRPQDVTDGWQIDTKSNQADSCKQNGTVLLRNFAPADVAPRVPDHPFFRLEQTTLTVPTDAPCDVVNALLDMIVSSGTASVTKVSYPKYALSVDAFPEAMCGQMCSLKVRLYDMQDAGCAVEFQRRSGDSFAFYAAYGEACRALVNKFPGASYPASEVGLTWPVVPDALASMDIDEDEGMFPWAAEEDFQCGLGPLLDLALCASPELQAEAAVGLMDVMGRSDNVELTPQTIDAIENLLETRTAAVAYPTLKLLTGLMQTDKAEQILQRQALVQNIRNLSTSDCAGSLAQHHAHQLLSSIPVGCAC
mmetsp:Transcript_26878/g.61986  ORF Transcript_26878/g.61986 Transcript_26878/m.61986 type:complete len:377 (-) Transcript_26878:169-1299(-)